MPTASTCFTQIKSSSRLAGRSCARFLSGRLVESLSPEAAATPRVILRERGRLSGNPRPSSSHAQTLGPRALAACQPPSGGRDAVKWPLCRHAVRDTRGESRTLCNQILSILLYIKPGTLKKSQIYFSFSCSTIMEFKRLSSCSSLHHTHTHVVEMTWYDPANRSLWQQL